MRHFATKRHSKIDYWLIQPSIDKDVVQEKTNSTWWGSWLINILFQLSMKYQDQPQKLKRKEVQTRCPDGLCGKEDGVLKPSNLKQQAFVIFTHFLWESGIGELCSWVVLAQGLSLKVVVLIDNWLGLQSSEGSLRTIWHPAHSPGQWQAEFLATCSSPCGTFPYGLSEYSHSVTAGFSPSEWSKKEGTLMPSMKATVFTT